MKMMMKTSAAAKSLILRGLLIKLSHEIGPNCQPYLFRPSPRCPWLDFSSIKVLDDAISMFCAMLRMQPMPSVLAFNKLLAIVAKMEHYQVALSMFDKMLQQSLPANNVYTMSIVINCCCLLNHVDFGFAFLGSFFRRGVEPDIATYTTLLKGLFLVHKVYDSERLFKKMLMQKLCEPDHYMFNTVTNGLCKAGQTLTALGLLGLFEKGTWKPDVYTYNTVIDSLCKDNMVEDALSLFSHMIRQGISPDIVTYNSMMHGLFCVGRFTTGLELFHDMEAWEVIPNTYTYNILLDGLCRNKQISKAFSLLKMMEDNGVSPDIVSYNVLIGGLCKDGKLEIARTLFDELPSKGLEPNVITFNVIIGAHFQSGMPEEALNLLTKMNILVQGFLKRNEYYKTIPFLEEMTARGTLDSHTMTMILDPQEEGGGVLLDMMQKFVEKK